MLRLARKCRVIGDFLHAQHGCGGHLVLAQDVDRLVFGLVGEPLLDLIEDFEDVRLSGFGLRTIGAPRAEPAMKQKSDNATRPTRWPSLCAVEMPSSTRLPGHRTGENVAHGEITDRVGGSAGGGQDHRRYVSHSDEWWDGNSRIVSTANRSDGGE